MASPSACGGVALVLSGMKATEQAITPNRSACWRAIGWVGATAIKIQNHPRLQPSHCARQALLIDCCYCISRLVGGMATLQNLTQAHTADGRDGRCEPGMNA